MGTIWGERLTTTDLDGSSFRVTQQVIFDESYVLVAARSWLIFYNDPSFTSIKMQIFADRAGSPGKLLYESASLTKAEIFQDVNAARELPFIFSKVGVRQDETYHCRLVAVAYTGNESSHIAWKKGWPDPVYREGVDSGANKLGVAPYSIYFVGAAL